jgi:NAD(P)-dependent dehydrogenase (short-subunit alcohol dehydrogenase family)
MQGLSDKAYIIAGAKATVDEIVESGGRAIAVEFDLADEDSVHQLVEATIAEFGAVHGLHNVGLTCPTRQSGSTVRCGTSAARRICASSFPVENVPRAKIRAISRSQYVVAALATAAREPVSLGYPAMAVHTVASAKQHAA